MKEKVNFSMIEKILLKYINKEGVIDNDGK